MVDEATIEGLVKDIREHGYNLAAITFLVKIRPVDMEEITEFHESESEVLRAL